MNDDHLRASLARRAGTALTDDERSNVLRAARLNAVAPRRRVLPRLAGYLVGLAAMIVLLIIVAPILLSPPSPIAPPTPSLIAERTTGPSSTESSASPLTSASTGIAIYTAEQLADMVGKAGWVGKTVLANAQLYSVTGPPEAFESPGVFACQPLDPCRLASLDPALLHVPVQVGWRDATAEDGVRYDDGGGYRWVKRLEVPSVPGTLAFKVGQDSVEYLGMAQTGRDDAGYAPSTLAGDPSDPEDTVAVVSGWLVHTLEAPCAFPQQGLESPMPDISSYYCGGSWLTDEAVGSPTSGLTIDGGLHVQGDAYDTFAPDPQPANGGGTEPRQGIYLVRNAGCPEVVTGDCPVWRMVGRLDDAPTTQTPSPSPSPSGVIQIYTAQQLADMTGNPALAGSTVLANSDVVEALPTSGATCPDGEVCMQTYGLISGTDVGVSIGWRDSVPGDGTRVDDGNGYRWMKPLEFPASNVVVAFAVRKDSVEYLGPALLGPEDGAAHATSLLGNPSDPSDTVFVVSGWLMHTLEAPCAFPQQGLESPMPDIGSYYCGGSWLTDDAVGSPTSGLTIDGGLHLQGDAYDTFAPDPQPANGGGTEPRQGIYLVRNAGCPEVVTGDCPVWRMVGRLDDSSQNLPANPIPSPDATVTIRTNPPTDICRDALFGGELVEDPTWGLAIRQTTGDVVGVVWPNGFSARRSGDKVQLIDDSANAVAATGDQLQISGGYNADGSWGACGPIQVGQSTSPTLHVSNGTTLTLTVTINDQVVGTVPARQISDFDPTSFAGPWHVAIDNESGRRLMDMTYSAGEVGSDNSSAHGVAQRLDLSCGRLDVYAGPPLLGPGPPASFPPGDCDP